MQYTIPLTAEGIPQVKWGEYSLENMPPICSADNQALLCGEISGIIGLDIDSDVEEARIMALLGVESSAYLAKRGSKGRTIFFKYSGEVSRSWKRDGKVVAELLSNKRLTTIPPSIHRTTGKRYVWINEGAPLVNLPDRLDEMLDFLYPAPARVTPAYTTTAYDNDDCDNDVSMEEVEQMLAHISADCSREDWLSIGMGLRDEFGDAAYGAWDSWSSGSAKYKQREMHNVWRSFNGSGVSIGSVIYHAQQSGWQRVRVAPIIQKKAVDVKQSVEVEHLVAHGLVGEIAEWITATAYRPQPQLSLGAALTFVGMLKGHKFAGNTGLRTNMLVLNLAPTASGKEHPLNCLWSLMHAAGLDKHILSEPQSGTALLNGLLKADRIGLMCIDEIGRFIGNIANKNSSGHLREVVDYFIKSFSKANSFLVGKQYANDKANPRIDIVNPHLCVLGATVKEKFIENCRSSDAIDGFLNRWVLFESKHRPRRQYKKISIGEPPASIMEAIAAVIAKAPPKPMHNQEVPLTHTIKLTPDAYELMESYSDTIEDLLDKSEYPLDALYSRSCEHVAKIALITCDNEFVRLRDVQFAINTVTESNRLIAGLAGLIADNDLEREHIKVLELIKRNGSMSNAKFINSTKRLSPKTRAEIIRDLEEAGEIIKEKCGRSYKYTYCADA